VSCIRDNRCCPEILIWISCFWSKKLLVNNFKNILVYLLRFMLNSDCRKFDWSSRQSFNEQPVLQRRHNTRTWFDGTFREKVSVCVWQRIELYESKTYLIFSHFFFRLKSQISRKIKCCLAMDPNKRWACIQLLEHPYFDNYLIENKREENKSKIFQNQAVFQSERKNKNPGVSRHSII
jgi:serine/threonine protein kinase